MYALVRLSGVGFFRSIKSRICLNEMLSMGKTEKTKNILQEKRSSIVKHNTDKRKREIETTQNMSTPTRKRKEYDSHKIQ